MNTSVYNMPSIESESKHHPSQSNSLDSDDAAKINTDDSEKNSCPNDMFIDSIDQNDRGESLLLPNHKADDHHIKPLKGLFDMDAATDDKLVSAFFPP